MRTASDYIHDNELEAAASVNRDKEDFAAIVPIGETFTGCANSGQMRWAIIRPARKTTEEERVQLRAAGFEWGRDWSLGDGSCGDRGTRTGYCRM